MNKKKITIILMVFLAIFSTIMLVVNKDNVEITNEVGNKSKKSNNLLTLNLEQTAGAGDYKTVTQSEWPTEGYKFNTELSRCENGSELSWDDTKKAVIVSGNLSDKCYVYFDIFIPKIPDICNSGDTLADCIKKYGDKGSAISNIYIHNSSLTNGAGDNSYRYAGTNPNNFVCFGSDASPCPTDNLYRIVGVFGDNYHGITGKQLVKLIKYDYANSNLLGTGGDYKGSDTPNALYYKGSFTTINTYYWNNAGKNTWSESNLNKTNLNTNFINNIGSTWANKIATTTWKVGGNTWANIGSKTPSVAYTNEITNPDATNSNDNATTYDAKIGLMYVSDYGFAADPSAWTTTLQDYDVSVNGATIRSQNWMYMGYYEWTISRSADLSSDAFSVYIYGLVGYSTMRSDRKGVRPSFNLESSVSYVSGSGSMSDPIAIK